MRQVKTRDTAAGRSGRAADRRRSGARAPELRPETRNRTQWGTGRGQGFLVRLRTRIRDRIFEPILDRVRATFPFRHPMLTLSALLMIAGGAVGIISGGHIERAIASGEADLDRSLAQAGFAIQKIQISGNDHTPEGAIDSALGIAKGQSLFAADPAGARARLKQLPWVADAVVRREFPNGLTVRVFEKHPFALWKDGTGLAVVERSGAVITAANAESFANLPLLMGAGAPKAAAPLIDALGRQRAVSARVRAVERVSDRRWDLLLAGGVTVKLPEEGWDKQLGDLESLIVDKAILERDVEIIDLRYPDNYVFRLHNGDSHPVPRERHA